MTTYNVLRIATKLPLKKVLQVSLGIFLLLLIVIFSCDEFTINEKIFSPWWVWELADEGEKRTIDPISWKVADNSMVLKISQQRLSPSEEIAASDVNSLQYALNKLKTTSFNENAIQSKEKLKTIVVLQEKVAQKFDVNHNLCGKCVVSNHIADAHNADAVVVEDDYARYQELPARSDNRQLFVWMNKRSPYHTLLKGASHLQRFDKAFNMTMSYRRDSDIVFPPFTTFDLLFYFEEEPLMRDPKFLEQIKSKFVYWMPKDCGNTKVSRMTFNIVYNLKISGLKIDSYGPCFHKRVDESGRSFNKFMKYKFYLALGNEWHCRDFIAHDVWTNALSIGAIPVIWGPRRQDVEALLPPKSYIFVEDFVSPFELANYLEYLDQDNNAIQQYKEWISLHFRELVTRNATNIPFIKGFCNLCKTLNEINPKNEHVVPSLYDWWVKQESSYCVKPQFPISFSIEYFQWKKEITIIKCENNFPLLYRSCPLFVLFCLCGAGLIIFIYAKRTFVRS